MCFAHQNHSSISRGHRSRFQELPGRCSSRRKISGAGRIVIRQKIGRNDFAAMAGIARET
jgi:hypothetical protein